MHIEKYCRINVGQKKKKRFVLFYPLLPGMKAGDIKRKVTSNLDAGGMGYLRQPGGKTRRDHGCCWMLKAFSHTEWMNEWELNFKQWYDRIVNGIKRKEKT